jgi:2-amino-4-hydroxy-6-hydroxymethyldihydropteridine diphosphokinase
LARVFIGIGSNIEPERNVRSALKLLSDVIDITGISKFYRCLAIDRPEQPDYYNGVIQAITGLAPHDLKAELGSIEHKLGRVRTDDVYAARTIDLDLLVYDELVTHGDLTLPDPDIRRRSFLALSLFELEPSLMLPDSRERVSDIAKAFSRDDLTPLEEFTQELRRDFLHNGR